MYLNFRFQAHAWRNKYYFFKEYSSFQKGLRLGLISRPDQTSVAPEAICTFPPHWCFPFTHSPFLTERLLSPHRHPTCSRPQGPHSADRPSVWGPHGGGASESGAVPTTPRKAPWLPQLTLGQGLRSGCHQPPRLPTHPDYQ